MKTFQPVMVFAAMVLCKLS